MKGKLIIIEGLDGSGKSTQMQLLCQRAEQLGKPVRRVKFPNYDEDSSALVKAYLSGELGSLQQINAYAASVLYSVDRYATWRRHMHSDYEQGAVFLLDRYTTANMYHQTTKLPHEEWDSFLDWLVDLEFQKMGLPAPDLVLYLDMRPQTARRLMEKRYHGRREQKGHPRGGFFLPDVLPGSGAVCSKNGLNGRSSAVTGKPAANRADFTDDLGKGRTISATRRTAIKRKTTLYSHNSKIKTQEQK